MLCARILMAGWVKDIYTHAHIHTPRPLLCRLRLGAQRFALLLHWFSAAPRRWLQRCVRVPLLLLAFSARVSKINGKVAYAAQRAWIQNATLRDNVLFGAPFDPERYSRVLAACALTSDLDLLEAGDQTEIGEKG